MTAICQLLHRNPRLASILATVPPPKHSSLSTYGDARRENEALELQPVIHSWIHGRKIIPAGDLVSSQRLERGKCEKQKERPRRSCANQDESFCKNEG